jgi:cytosine/adenosine deaminase-related metal-dependent hydrolase
MREHGRWAALLALVLLLALGVGAAMLWPTPSKAELVAAKVEVGMTWIQTCEITLPLANGPYWSQEEGTTGTSPTDRL